MVDAVLYVARMDALNNDEHIVFDYLVLHFGPRRNLTDRSQ
jgi:hypothetical protein